MKNIRVAFDIDGILLNDRGIINEEMRTLLILLSKMKNIEIVVWSGGGTDYVRRMCDKLGIDKYVTMCSRNGLAREEIKCIVAWI